MAKLQIPITEELMQEAKMFALKNGMTLKDLVIQALTTTITNTSNTTNTEQPSATSNTTSTSITPKEANTTSTDTTSIITTSDNTSSIDNTTSPEDFYLLRKTHKTSLPIPGSKQYALGPYTWMLFDGSKAHFDKEGQPIPIRYTDENGKVQEPDKDELQELSEYLGKPVKIEK